MKTRNKYYNPHPKKSEKVGDCVIRALCKATNKDWLTIYKELCELGLELYALPNSDITWKEYLERNNFIKHKLVIKKGSKRPTVDSFSRANPKGIFVLNLANHIVTCEDGFYYDIWDSGECCLYNYWEKPE